MHLYRYTIKTSREESEVSLKINVPQVYFLQAFFCVNKTWDKCFKAEYAEYPPGISTVSYAAIQHSHASRSVADDACADVMTP